MKVTPATSEGGVCRIVVTPVQSVGRRFVDAANEMGIDSLRACATRRLFFIQGVITQTEAEQIAGSLLADPVTEVWYVESSAGGRTLTEHTGSSDHSFIEVTLHPGVTDPPAENLVRSAHRLGIAGVQSAASGWHYDLSGPLSDTELQRLAIGVFANPVIQHTAVNRIIQPPFVPARGADETVETISLRGLNDDQLLSVSQERRLALNLVEMQAIQAWYAQQDRDPTDVELEMLAQTWSEHCVHKTFKSPIHYTGPDGRTQLIPGILNTYIRAATNEVNKPWVRSAFVDNAGIIAFDDEYDLAFKLETHNHPSALEPFGGANTGIGGVVRDILGVSARPIANTDVLCFGYPDMPPDEVPQGVLHPSRIRSGVVAGIEDYGNKMGIPTVNGAVLYHPGYTANPLVFCGCLGILPHGLHPTEPRQGDLIVAIGGRTGRDGLRGATFSSMEMDVETGEIAGTAVQIGHPIMEKQVQEVILCARDERLYSAITDCGAGGFSSAVGEMAEELGATVQLQAAKLKYPGLRPWEIWLSEAQERMVLSVPPEKWGRLQQICDGFNVEAVRLGEFTSDGQIRIYNGDALVGELDVDFLHNGLPLPTLEAVWEGAPEQVASVTLEPAGQTPQATLLALLSHPDIRSKEDIIRLYDHEVQGGTAVKPLVGIANNGPSDAAVIVPQPTQSAENVRGVALSNGICPQYTDADPYQMAWAAVDEVFRNLTAVGADPDEVALLDNFCWGNPKLPDRLGSLVRSAQGCYDAALAFNAPFISGKDSLNNEYTGEDSRKHAIPGTLLISALGMVPDVNHVVTMPWKQAGNSLYLVGATAGELGRSHFEMVDGVVPPQHRQIPAPNTNALAQMRSLHQAIRRGLVQSCHDCSEGGLAVALAEMSLAGGLGAEIEMDRVPVREGSGQVTNDVLLFAESLTRFVVEVSPADAAQFEALLADVPCRRIGTVGGTDLRIRPHASDNGAAWLIDLPVAALSAAWSGSTVATVASERVSPRPSALPTLTAPALSRTPSVLILHANGTNRDHDAALACELAGAKPEIVHVNQLLAGARSLTDYHMLLIPGGFSYGDDLGAGVLWAQDLRLGLGADLNRFVAEGRPVLGICNGFQALVKAGVLPGINGLDSGDSRRVTLTYNESGRFECRWVWLEPNRRSPSLFTQGIAPIACPAAHGEGRLAVSDEDTLEMINSQQLIPLTYGVAPHMAAEDNGVPYPANPNGSALNAAALCNPAGNVLGLMPHPENHIFPWQNPAGSRSRTSSLGLQLFINGVRSA